MRTDVEDFTGISLSMNTGASAPDFYRLASQQTGSAGKGIECADLPIHFDCFAPPIDCRLRFGDLVRIRDTLGWLGIWRKHALLDLRKRFDDAARTQERQSVMQRTCR